MFTQRFMIMPTAIKGEHMEQKTGVSACAAITTVGYNVNNVVALSHIPSALSGLLVI